MAEEAKGQRFSQRAGGFLDKITGNQGAQQTQQTQQQTSGQQSTGGVFLPGISNNQNLINSNKVSMNNGFTQGIQDGTIKSNIVLPGITTKPQTGATFSGLTPKYPNATMTAMTPDEVKEMDKIAKNNGTYKESWNDRIWDEMYKAETIPLLKQGIKQTRDSLKKFGKRMHSDLVESMANVGYVNGAFGAMGSENAQARRDEYINEARESNQKYQDEVNEAFSKRVDKNMNKTLAERYSQTSWRKALKEGDWNNLKYGTKQAFSTSILPMVPGIIAGLVTKNPAVLQGTVFVSTLPIEDQEAYEDAMEFGATKEEATAIGHIVGIVNAKLESLGDMAQFGGLFKRTIKQGLRREVKRSMKSILLRGVKELAKGTGTESLTEGLQELTKNVLVRAINHDKNILEGVGESAFYGGVLGLGGSSIGAGGQVLNDVQENEKIQAQADIEALKYVAEGEQRKAQRMAREKARARFLERVKNPTMDNGYTPTEEQAQQREQEKIENEEYEQELQDKYDEETRIENDMMNEVLSEGDLNEDLGDPRYQKSDSPQSVSEDTVREKSRTGNVSISSENSSEISKNLNEIKKNLEDLKADTFLQQIKKSISGDEKNSNYITNRINGNKYVLRIADHHANAKNSKKSPYNNTSIVVKLVKRKNNGKNIQFKKYKSVDMMEFVYNPENMTPATMQGIIEGIQNWIKTGEYTDTNYDSKNQSTRKIGENKKSETGEKYQLKYEEEGYTPGVARKDERNISGKSGKMLKDFLKGQTIEELAKKYGVERIDVVKGLVDGMAYGSYSNRILRLAEEIKESTAPHELLHLVFDMVDPETKTYLISQVMQSEGWSAEKAEEWLADSFSNFYRTGKIESAPKSTWGKIKIFFKRVRSFINGMWKWRNQLERMFTDIIESSGIEELQGKIDSNKEINESKAKMRKRFLEYRRNAEKTQIKTNDNNEKYQTVYHGSPYDFDKFDSANMGKGEGAQAHGWGHYVAVEESTGRHYAELKGRMGNAEYKGKSLNDLYRDMRSPEGEEYTLAMDVLTAHKDYNIPISEAIKKSKEYYENEIKKYEDFLKDEGLSEMHKTYRSIIEKYKKKIDIIDNMKESDFTGTDRNLYEVEIPDPVKADTPTGSNYLEEDGKITKEQNKKILNKLLKQEYGDYNFDGLKPTSEMTEKDIDKTIEKVKSKDANLARTLELEKETAKRRFQTSFFTLGELFETQISPRLNGKELINLLSDNGFKPTVFEKLNAKDGRELYRDIAHLLGSDKQASNFLESLGYDGIHYFGGRDGEAYVIFNDNALEITNHEKYQKAGDINSEKFKKRFGDSKVVDENGKPMIVYHGTPYGGFTVFDKVNRGSIGDTGYFGDGFYFTNDKKLAKDYSDEAFIDLEERTKEAGQYGNVEIKEVYLKIENPYKINEKDVDYEMGSLEKLLGTKNPSESTKKLKSLGYDGIIYTFNSGTKEYTVFDPNQIKSAIDNVGTYDPNNEDIRYQRVYHGSPNEFDRFDSSHMGEGEGNQAHGWGHYVAVDPKTARRYAQEPFRKNEVEIKGKVMSRTEDVWDIPYALRTLYRDLYSFFSFGYYDFDTEINNAIDQIKKEYEDTVEYYENLIKDDTKPPVEMSKEDLEKMRKDRKESLKEFREALEFIEDLKPEDIEVREVKDRRNFYEVEIPDPVKANTPTGKNYIEEENRIGVRAFNRMLKRFEKDGREVENGYGNYTVKKGDDEITLTNPNNTWKQLIREDIENPKLFSQILNRMGYNGIHYFGGVDGEAYVVFNDDDLEIKNHEKYQKVEYEYDENGNRKWIKFEEDNGEFDPSIFGEPSREEQIADDKENEKNNPFYNAWIRYNNQNYKDDQLTFEEFIQGISERGDKEQAEYNKKLSDISEAQNDPQLLDLQLRAVKLMEEEGNVGKKFGKNVSKEVRDRQQKEVESKREQLISDIVDYMYPGLKTEEITYDMQKEADQKEAEREMLGREDLEEKLKYFKKDKNGNREAKEVKIENPQIKLDKILSAGKFEEIFTPLDRVIEWRTPQGQHGVIDNQKNPKQYKSVMEKINTGKTKTKVTLNDVTRDYRALEKYKADQEAEKARKKKERDEAYAKKKQEEYKKIVRMKAFQRLVDMQRFEKYPFLTEEEIKNRYGFTDEEWKKITEQEEIKLPKKRGEKAISDLNKAVDSQVKALIEGLSWQNNLKRKDAEKNLGEIGEIDVDILLGRDEEKGQKEVEEFERLAKDKGEDTTKKRLKEAQENIMDVEIDKERENSKSERERIDKLIKSTKTDKTVRGSLKKFTSDIITPVSTKIKEISPKIYREVMRYFQNKDILTNQRLKNIDPFLKALGKIKKENPVRFMDVRVALANRNIGYANGLLKEYGVTVPTKLLDEIYVEADDVGLNINYLGSYYPLSVKAPKSFLEELMKVDKGDIASEIEKRIQKESQKKGGPLEESEITAIINDVIAGGDKGPDINTGNKHLKKRNTEIKRTPKMLEYCDDPISTLITYIEGMTQSIERAKFLGKSRSGNVHTLADYVYNAKNGLTPDQQDDLMDLLKAVFNDESPNKFVQTWRDLGTLTTLGSPSSTLTQLGDLSFSVYENGWKEALKAVWDVFSDKKVFNLEDMGVINRGEEYTNINSQKNLLQKAIHNVFKLTFFSNFDTFGKSTFIQSTWNKRRKRSLKGEHGDSQLRKDIMKWADDEYMTDKIIEDLRKGVFSQDVALVMYMKLGNIQPLTKAQMPKAYLNNPNRRLFYQFKTFGIKQLDYVLQETKENTKNFKNLSTMDKMLKIAQIANMVFIMTLLGVGADELKDITMRRRSNSLILRWLFGENVGSEQIWEKMEDNVLKLFGLSRYTIMQMKNDPVDAITSLFTTLPATNLINYPFKDIYKAFKDGSINWRNPASYQLIPVVGKYRYWIYGGGQDKQQQALDKENKKSTKKKSSGSTRKPLKR